MKKLALTLSSISASMVAAIILSTMLDGAQPTVENIEVFVRSVMFHKVTLSIPVAVIGMVLAIFVLAFLFLKSKTLVEVKCKNNDALLVNISLLDKLKGQDVPLTIRSTRFSEWTVQDGKSTTRSFRTILSQISADENHEIQRLWVIRSKEDYSRLLHIAKLYEGHSSTSIKYIDLESCPNLIEVFIVGDRIATIGVPTGRHGATIGLSVKTSNSGVVSALNSYFDILYSGASFALDKGVLKINSRRVGCVKK